MAPVYIYSLSDPETGRVRYIGKANNMRERFASHLRGSRWGTLPSCRWINKLLSANLMPVMTVLFESDTENWEKIERQQIALHRAMGFDLLNVAPGGAAPHPSKETRAKAGRTAAQARVKTPEDAEAYRIKTAIGNELKWSKKNNPDGYVRLCDMIRPLAKQYPDFFGTWSHL